MTLPVDVVWTMMLFGSSLAAVAKLIVKVPVKIPVATPVSVNVGRSVSPEMEDVTINLSSALNAVDGWSMAVSPVLRSESVSVTVSIVPSWKRDGLMESVPVDVRYWKEALTTPTP